MFKGVLITTQSTNSATTLNNEYIALATTTIGSVIEFQLGPLTPNQTFVSTVQVKYSTGQLSTRTSSFTFTVEALTAIPPTPVPPPNPVPPPPQPPQPPQPPPAPPVPPPAPAPSTRRDNYVNEFSSEVTSAGISASPRFMTFQLGIAINTYYPVNNAIIGFNFYIKEYTETYYRKITAVDSSWDPKNYYNFQLFFTNYSVANIFDFIIRVVYNDGSESTQQSKGQFRLASPFNVYPYNPFASAGFKQQTSTSISTTDQAPPGAAVDPLDTVMALTQTLDGQFNNPKLFGTVPTIVFILDLPNAANRNTWYGQKVRYRRVMPGSDPPFETKWDKTTTPDPDYGNIDTLYVDNIVYDQKYEYVITPQVMSGGSIVDAKQSWYGVGYIHNNRSLPDYPSNYNWNKNFNWQLIQTSTALQTIDASFPVPVAGDAVIQISAFETRQVPNVGEYANYSGYFELAHWHYVTFASSHIANFSKLHIYRRDARLNAGAGTTSNSVAGLGRWERIVWNSGTTLNLRGPTSGVFNGGEYYWYFGVAGYASSFPTLKPSAIVSSPIYNSGKMINNFKTPIVSAKTAGQEFLFVVEFTDTTLSSKGLLVKTTAMTGSTPVNQILGTRPVTVNVSDYNPYTAGLERNLNETRTTATVNAAPLGINDIGLSSAVPAATGGLGIVTKPLQYPTTYSGSAISPGIV
jgi:hypothetical protein